MAVDPSLPEALLPKPGARRKKRLASRRFKEYRGQRRNSLRGSYDKATGARVVGQLRYWKTIYSVWAKRPGAAHPLTRVSRWLYGKLTRPQPVHLHLRAKRRQPRNNPTAARLERAP